MEPEILGFEDFRTSGFENFKVSGFEDFKISGFRWIEKISAWRSILKSSNPKILES
jgi:hypothetical protein